MIIDYADDHHNHYRNNDDDDDDDDHHHLGVCWAWMTQDWGEEVLVKQTGGLAQKSHPPSKSQSSVDSTFQKSFFSSLTGCITSTKLYQMSKLKCKTLKVRLQKNFTVLFVHFSQHRGVFPIPPKKLY